MANKPYNVLFLCTGNSARSIIAESLLNARSCGRLRGYSAGSHPARQVNAQVLEFLREKHVDADGARSKSWDEFAGKGAPTMDLIITVCDSAAGEACPIWPGRPITAHWGVADPAAQADPAKARKAIEEAFRVLEKRIARLLELPVDELDRAAVQAKAREIGRES